VKVVFDTNIFVSALVFPGGRGEDALQGGIALAAGKHQRGHQNVGIENDSHARAGNQARR
jgi:hypothetical protein